MDKLTRNELMAFMHKRSDAISMALITLHIVMVLLPIYLAASLPLGWVTLITWLWFGITANGLTLLLHECSHFLVFRRKSWSVWLGVWFLGPLLLTDFEIYRARHWIHHTSLGQTDDTKKTYLSRIDGWHSLRLLLRVMLLREAMSAMARQIFQLRNYKESDAHLATGSSIALIPLLSFQGALAASLALCVWLSQEGTIWQYVLHWLVVYGGVYLYGLASLTVLMAHIRAIAEHSQLICDDARVVGLSALRTLKVNYATRFVFGAYGFADHATHHLHPGIPCYSLPSLTAYLSNRGPEFNARYGYLQLMWLGFRSRGVLPTV